MRAKHIIISIDPEGLLIKCNVHNTLMFFQNKLLVNQEYKLVADMMNGWMDVCVYVHGCAYMYTYTYRYTYRYTYIYNLFFQTNSQYHD